MKTAKHRNTKPFDQINWCEEVKTGNICGADSAALLRGVGGLQELGVWPFHHSCSHQHWGEGCGKAAIYTRHHVSWVYHQHQTDYNKKYPVCHLVIANQEFWPVDYFAMVNYLRLWFESHLCGDIVSDKIAATVQFNIHSLQTRFHLNPITMTVRQDKRIDIHYTGWSFNCRPPPMFNPIS